MKFKKGFTITEVLIAVGIIGIISALMVTTFNNVKPDKDKVMYLKAYDALTEAVEKMVNSPGIYSGITKYTYSGSVERSFDVSKYPMLDLQAPTSPNYQNSTPNPYNGAIKFANLLADALNGERKANCGANVTSCKFTTNSGAYTWTVTPKYPKKLGNAISTKSKVSYYNIITLNINGTDYTFNVCADGEIRVADKKGATYIKNRKNFRSKNDSSGAENSVLPDAISVNDLNPEPAFNDSPDNPILSDKDKETEGKTEQELNGR